ncbi:MAG: Uma2 family endonuclease [Pseudonocardia sp.]
MAALPLQDRLLSVDEYAALPEDSDARYELHEGAVVMSPKPVPRHQRCQWRFGRRLESLLPAGYELLPDVDVDLQLAPRHAPGFARAPDLVVVDAGAADRVHAEGGFILAREVLVVVEILSPTTKRTDTVVKHAEYADAGIPHYWMIDIEKPVSLVACHLGGELGYVDAPAVTGTFRTTVPFTVAIELDALI